MATGCHVAFRWADNETREGVEADLKAAVAHVEAEVMREHGVTCKLYPTHNGISIRIALEADDRGWLDGGPLHRQAVGRVQRAAIRASESATWQHDTASARP